MVLPWQSTFDYVGALPTIGDPPWTVDLVTNESRRDPSRPSLLGPAARLTVTDAGLTPNPGFTRGEWRPEVLRLRLELTPADERAAAARAFFHIDRGVAKAFRPGDRIHVCRTGCGGCGFSVVRGGDLVVALGALRSVPLGERVSAQIPTDLISEVEAVFRRRDPHFEVQVYPIEITIDGVTCVVPGGGGSLPDWHVWVLAAAVDGIPGTDETGVILRRGACSDLAVYASAQLMMSDGITVEV